MDQIEVLRGVKEYKKIPAFKMIDFGRNVIPIVSLRKEADFMSYLLAKETRRPLLLGGARYSKPCIYIGIDPQSGGIRFRTSSLRFHVIANRFIKKYFSIHRVPPFLGRDLSIEISFPTRYLNNCKNIASLVNVFSTILKPKIRLNRGEGVCKHCGGPITYADVDICEQCLHRVPLANLKKFCNTLDPKLLEDCELNLTWRKDFITFNILLDLKNFVRRLKYSDKCILCGREDYSSSWYNKKICDECLMKYDMNIFSIDYMNGRVTWTQFENDPQVRRRYLRRE